MGRHPPPPRDARAPHAVRRDRPRDRAVGGRRARAAAVPGPAHGLGPGRRLERAGGATAAGRSGSSTPRPIRHLRPVACHLPARRSDRRGRRASSPTAPTSRRDEAVTVAEYREVLSRGEGRGRRRVLPAGRGPGARRVGAPAGAGDPRRGRGVEVFVLHRPSPRRRRCARATLKQLVRPLLQPLRTELDGLKVTYVPFVAPPRPRSYASWGTWAAPTLALALRNRFDLVHAHYAVPAGDAARRQQAPLVISVHGGDVLGVAEHFKGGREAVTRAFEAARLTLANSAAIAERSRALGARRRPRRAPRHRRPAAHHARHARRHGRQPGRAQAPRRRPACAHAAARHPLRDRRRRAGAPRAGAPRRPTRRRRGVPRRAPAATQALRAARSAGAFVLPSTEEAFGVAYIEAMAGGVPAIGTRGEPGPEEIAACGGGMRLVPPHDPPALAQAIREALADGGDSRPRERRAPTSPGSSAARPRSPPTRTRCDEAGALRHQPRARVPRRRVPGAATNASTSSSR